MGAKMGKSKRTALSRKVRAKSTVSAHDLPTLPSYYPSLEDLRRQASFRLRNVVHAAIKLSQQNRERRDSTVTADNHNPSMIRRTTRDSVSQRSHDEHSDGAEDHEEEEPVVESLFTEKEKSVLRSSFEEMKTYREEMSSVLLSNMGKVPNAVDAFIVGRDSVGSNWKALNIGRVLFAGIERCILGIDKPKILESLVNGLTKTHLDIYGVETDLIGKSVKVLRFTVMAELERLHGHNTIRKKSSVTEFRSVPNLTEIDKENSENVGSTLQTSDGILSPNGSGTKPPEKSDTTNPSSAEAAEGEKAAALAKFIPQREENTDNQLSENEQVCEVCECWDKFLTIIVEFFEESLQK